jgi:hypothetical protein
MAAHNPILRLQGRLVHDPGDGERSTIDAEELRGEFTRHLAAMNGCQGSHRDR